MPSINLATLEAGVDTAMAVLRVIAWANLCQCRPGTPSPTPYPPPNPSQPVGWPAVPTFTCDSADLCGTLVTIQKQLAAISGALASQGELVNLLQRYRLPFAYVPGAVHSGLSDSGQFAVSRLVGVQAAVTAAPPDTPALFGNPPYLMNLGWLSIGDSRGFFDEKRLTRDSLLWLPPQMPQATRFSWALSPGTVVQLTELQAET